MRNRILLYFVKYPEPGKVKTRLARSVGDRKAAELYRTLAEENLRIAASASFVRHSERRRRRGEESQHLRSFGPRHWLCQCRGPQDDEGEVPGTVADFSIILVCEPVDKMEQFRDWLGKDFEYWPQRGEGLGERLRAAFQQAFDEGASQVLALGSDTLNFRAEILSQAFEALKSCDVVLGPARDGGYYLIGMHSRGQAKGSAHLSVRYEGGGKTIVELFQNIPWSTEQVLSMTLERATKLELSYHLLEALEDLDDGVKGERQS